MSDDQDGCEWVNVSSGTSPGSLGQRAVKRLCMLCHIEGYKQLYGFYVNNRVFYMHIVSHRANVNNISYMCMS